MTHTVKQPISRLYDSLKSRAEVRALIPMGYVAAMPIIKIRNGQLIAAIPFLRYKVTGEVDRTLVYPIRYILEYLIPECQPAGFKDLMIEEGYEDFDFDKVTGFFRHDAVKHLDRDAYMTFKANVLERYDRLVNYLTGETDSYTAAEDNMLAKDLQTIIEPFVISRYGALDKDFYNKYLK